MTELVAVVAAGEAVLLVGAGSSMSAGFASWTGLLQHLEQRADEASPPVRGTHAASILGALQRAARARDRLVRAQGWEHYHGILGRLFHRPAGELRAALTSFHRDLVRLPFRALLTTNYDRVLEAALEAEFPAGPMPMSVAVWNGDQQLISPGLRSIAVPGGPDAPRYILHLHGLISLGRSIVLCADDYADAYGIPELAGPDSNGGGRARGNVRAAPPAPARRPTLLYTLVSSLLATRRVVFVGFSLDDPYFTEVLRRVSDAMWEWGGSVHFAILPIAADRAPEQRLRARELKTALGIETVFYEVSVSDHATERDALVARLRHEVDARHVAAPDARPAIGDPAGEAKSTAPDAAGGPRLPQWALANNAAQRARLDRHAD